MGIRVRFSADCWRGCTACGRSGIIYEGPPEHYRAADYADGLCARCRAAGRKPHPGTIADAVLTLAILGAVIRAAWAFIWR